MQDRGKTRELITPDTLIHLSLDGRQDVMTCRVCGQKEIIPFEYINGSKQTVDNEGNRLSLVLKRGAKKTIIRQFKKEHLTKCLLVSEKKTKEYL